MISGALLGLLAAAVFMLAVLPILLKAKEDQVNEDDRMIGTSYARDHQPDIHDDCVAD